MLLRPFLLVLALLALGGAAVAAEPVDTRLRLGIMDWASDETTNELWDGNITLSLIAYMFVAVEHFNDRRVDLVPDLARVQQCNKQIEIVEYCESAGNPLRATQNAAYLVEQKQVHLVEGPGGVDDGYAMLRYLASRPTGMVPAMSHFVTALQLSDKRQFPNFARSMPSELDSAYAMMDFVKQLKLTSLAMVGVSDTAGYATTLEHYLSGHDDASHGTEAEELEGAEEGGGIHLHAHIYGYENLNHSIYAAVGKAAEEELNTILITAWAAHWPMVANALAAYGLLTEEHTILIAFSEREPTLAEFSANPNLVTMFHRSLRLVNRVDQNPNFQRVQAAWEHQSVDTINPMLPPKGTKSDLTCANSKFNAQLPQDFFQTSKHLANEINAYAYDAMLAIGFALCELSPTADTGIPTGEQLMRRWTNDSFEFSGLSTEHFKFDAQSADPSINGSNYRIVNYYFDKESASPLKLLERIVGQWTKEGTFALNVGEFDLPHGHGVLPTTSTPPYHEQNIIPDGLRILTFILLAVLLTLEVSCAVWLVYNRSQRLVINSQPLLMWLILFGCTLASLALVPLISDDTERDLVDPNLGCMLTPALFLLGSSVAVLAICSKTYRIQTLFVNPKLRHVKYTAKEAVRVILAGMIFPITVLVVWWALSPLTFERVVERSDVHGNPEQSYSMCAANNPFSGAMFGLMLAFYGVFLAYAVVLANRVRDVPTEFHESKWISFAVASLMQIYFLAIPTVAAVYLQVVGRFILLLLIIFSSVLILLTCIFGSKISAFSLGRDLMPRWMLDKLKAGTNSSDVNSASNKMQSKRVAKIGTAGGSKLTMTPPVTDTNDNLVAVDTRAQIMTLDDSKLTLSSPLV